MQHICLELSKDPVLQSRTVGKLRDKKSYTSIKLGEKNALILHVPMKRSIK